MGQIIYENGPLDGETNAYNFRSPNWFADTFTVSSASATVTGIEIWVWVFPTNHNPGAEVSITSQPNGGMVYFDQVVQFNESECYADGYGFSICKETATWDNGPLLSNGSYWVNLKNGTFPSGDQVFWDANSGVGCHSQGCPSQATSPFGDIPSEAFTILGNANGDRKATGNPH
jgi:hypothetical protein